MPSRQNKKLLLITPGDPSGIGSEVVWKTLKRRDLKRGGCDFLCIGSRAAFEKLGARVVEFGEPRPSSPHIWLISAPTPKNKRLHREGFQAGWSIETAARMILAGGAGALVTGPISKERLQKGGFPYTGHTDFLAALCGVDSVTMMLANSRLRVSLVTTHLALSEVSRALSRAGLRKTILDTAKYLRDSCGIKKPRIAVAALNPHAGESGLFGKEEIQTISPEIFSLKKEFSHAFKLFGPLPSDTLFARHWMALPKERYDAVVCMYHDQGLIPVKLIDFPSTVNVTLGLPIIRTSVDHGVAFDIAGKNLADPTSFRSALSLAMDLLNRRRY